MDRYELNTSRFNTRPVMCSDMDGSWVRWVDAKAEIERLQREKQARIYYQNIVYRVCTLLDAIEGRCVQHGKGIVCGTLETPEAEVEEAMERTKTKIERLKVVEGKLPKCWRLKDGKLVQDVPVVPGMVVFWTGPMDREIVRREVIGLAKDQSIPETAPTLWGLKFRDGGTGFACQCTDTREAAEAAEGGDDET